MIRFSFSVIARCVRRPATTRSVASSKSCAVMLMRRARPARIAASLQRFARSAPVRPEDVRAMASRSTSSASGLPFVWTSRMARRPLMSGGGTSTWRSKRPGRSSAGSRWSRRFVEAITTTPAASANPSSSISSWFRVWSASRLKLAPERAMPTASSSSMKMIAGACARAVSKSLRMRAAPSPTNISTNDDADWAKKVAPDSPATARASSVLPVPGGPCSSTPLGTRAPSAAKRSRLAQELDDLHELGAGLVDACDVVPAELRVLGPDRLLGRRVRHQLDRLPDQVDEQAEQHDRKPREDERDQLAATVVRGCRRCWRG